MDKPTIRVGETYTVGKDQFKVRELCGGFKSAQRRAFVIRRAGGECSFRRIGRTYCIVDKLPPTPPDYFLK